jgi:hypothetical protein
MAQDCAAPRPFSYIKPKLCRAAARPSIDRLFISVAL